ncbi:MAG TPA: hypothetical protein VFE53_25570 [Mucilaginibacter sp.]|jgi:hypothetical protein|nr:hypothetical protein [Mucilaginibacter sp.]
MKKNVTKYLFAIISLTMLFFFNAASGQPVPALQSTSFQTGRLYTTDGKKVKFYTLTMEGNVSRYKVNAGDSAFTEISKDKILKIKVKVKNTALSIAAGAIGGLGAGFWLIDGDNVTVSGPPGTKTFVVLATTVTGTFIGVVVWIFEKKYTTVYQKDKVINGVSSN